MMISLLHTATTLSGVLAMRNCAGLLRKVCVNLEHSQYDILCSSSTMVEKLRDVSPGAGATVLAQTRRACGASWLQRAWSWRRMVAPCRCFCGG